MMVLAPNAIQKFVPFAFMVFAFAITIWFVSVPPLSTLSVEDTALFWAAEMAVLLMCLLWLQSHFDWPRDSVVNYAKKTIYMAAIAAIVAAIPSLFLDFAFGIIPTEPLSELSNLQVFGVYAIEFAEEVAMLFVPCVVILTVINWLRSVGVFTTEVSTIRAEDLAPVNSAALTTEETPEFWEKVERRRHGRLLALEAQQHYMLVHTTVGTELIHYGFGKAVEELEHWEGAQVHRSFWVARAGIEEIVIKGRECTITLTSGASIPVSRGRKTAALAEFQP